MNATLVRTALSEVLQFIQEASGLECAPMVGGMKPIEDLPKFDSKIWPVAIGMLGAKLGITIANDENIFRLKDSCIAQSIDEIVALVSKLAEAQTSQQLHQANSQ